MVTIHGILSMSGMCRTCALIQRDVQWKTAGDIPVDTGYGGRGFPKSGTLWWTNKKLLKMTINSGFSHKKWWFSIAMLNYQRVIQPAEDSLRCHLFVSSWRYIHHFRSMMFPAVSILRWFPSHAWMPECILIFDIPIKNLHEITMFVGLVSHSIPLNHH